MAYGAIVCQNIGVDFGAAYWDDDANEVRVPLDQLVIAATDIARTLTALHPSCWITYESDARNPTQGRSILCIPDPTLGRRSPWLVVSACAAVVAGISMFVATRLSGVSAGQMAVSYWEALGAFVPAGLFASSGGSGS